MKSAILFIVLALSVCGLNLYAQNPEFIAPRSPEVPFVVPSQISPRPEIGGIVAAAFKNPKAYQLVNPLAPKHYGNGERFVSVNPEHPDKPKGIIVVSLEW